MRGRTGFEEGREGGGGEGEMDPGGRREGGREVCTHAEGSGVEEKVDEGRREGRMVIE